MRVTETDLPGVLLIEPQVHDDSRGFFVETYNEKRYREYGIEATFLQDNHSQSRRGTLRGLHAQAGTPQGKLVRVSDGEIFDVAVDIRPKSPTFGRWVGVYLSAENFMQCYVPEGFAHGFCVISEVAEVQYKCTGYYDPDSEITVAWNDPELAINWPVEEPILSAKDARARALREGVSQLAGVSS